MRPSPLMVPESHAIEVAGWRMATPRIAAASSLPTNGRRSPAGADLDRLLHPDGGGRGAESGRCMPARTEHCAGWALPPPRTRRRSSPCTPPLTWFMPWARRPAVTAYRRSGGFGLKPAGRDWPAGDAACHVAVDPQGRFLVVACWGDGQVLLYELDGDGGISARSAAAASTLAGRPSRARQPDARRRQGDDHRPRARPPARSGTMCPATGCGWTTNWPSPGQRPPAPGPASRRQRAGGDRVLD